jgi:group I intron endonuclease
MLYVGWTSTDFKTRWKLHLYEVQRGGKYYFNNAIRKYGSESFTYEILSTVNTVAEAHSLEQLWISVLRTYDPEYGYNMTYGGEGAKHTIGTRKKLRELRLGKSPVNKGKSNVEFFGKERAAAIKNQNSSSKRGKISPIRGIPRTQEVKNKIRNTLISKKLQSSKKGRTYEEIYGREKAVELKRNLRSSVKLKRLYFSPPVGELQDVNLTRSDKGEHQCL